jgi:hypothetical protein
MHKWCINKFIENNPKYKKCPICREDIEYRFNIMKNNINIC